jgi:nitroreductase
MALIWVWILLVLALTAAPVTAAGPQSVALPPRPDRSGADLVAALEQRRTTREFTAVALTLEDISALLWAGNGFNRTDGRRTAPTARNRQYIELYLAGAGGAFRYDAAAHALVAVTDADVRDRMGQQAHVASASHVLVLAADLARVPAPDEATRLAWAHSTAGAVAQNVALMAAARGIGTGMVALIRADEIRRSLSLPPGTIPLYVMPLGYLKK